MKMDSSCATFRTEGFAVNSECYAEFKVLSTDLVHAELLTYLKPVVSTVEQRLTALSTQISNGNVAEALSADGQTMSTPSDLAGSYGSYKDNLYSLSKEIDRKAYEEAMYQCDDFIDYCKSRMREYNLSDAYTNFGESQRNFWTEDDKHYETWRHTMMNAMYVQCCINEYHGLDDDFVIDTSFTDRISESTDNYHFGFKETYEEKPIDTFVSNNLFYDKISEINDGDWTRVEGETNTYEYTKGKGPNAYTYKKVTNDDGEILYYSASRDDSQNSGNKFSSWAGYDTKFYTNDGKLISPDVASRLVTGGSSVASVSSSVTTSNSSDSDDSGPFIPNDMDNYWLEEGPGSIDYDINSNKPEQNSDPNTVDGVEMYWLDE